MNPEEQAQSNQTPTSGSSTPPSPMPQQPQPSGFPQQPQQPIQPQQPEAQPQQQPMQPQPQQPMQPQPYPPDQGFTPQQPQPVQPQQPMQPQPQQYQQPQQPGFPQNTPMPQQFNQPPMPPTPPTDNSKTKNIIVIAAIAVGAIALLSIVIFFVMKSRTVDAAYAHQAILGNGAFTCGFETDDEDLDFTSIDLQVKDGDLLQTFLGSEEGTGYVLIKNNGNDWYMWLDNNNNGVSVSQVPDYQKHPLHQYPQDEDGFANAWDRDIAEDENFVDCKRGADASFDIPEHVGFRSMSSSLDFNSMLGGEFQFPSE